MKARDERVALMNEVRQLFDFSLRMMNGFVACFDRFWVESACSRYVKFSFIS